MPTSPPPTCPYCGSTAECVGGDVLYPHRGDMGGKFFWRCPKTCGAWVGCHLGTRVPLGRLADAELRAAKRDAHNAFDPLWRSRSGGRNTRNRRRAEAYAQLAAALGIPRDQCHIGMFDLETCRRAIALCAELGKALAGNV